MYKGQACCPKRRKPVLSTETTLCDYKERPKLTWASSSREKGNEAPAKSITIDYVVAGKRKEMVGKEMELIAQQD
jgi:hypothetical protein